MALVTERGRVVVLKVPCSYSKDRLVAHKSFFSSSRASSCSTNPSSPKHTRLKAPSCPSMLPGCTRHQSALMSMQRHP